MGERSRRRAYSYVDRGRYAGQLTRFIERFGRASVIVVLTEHLADDLATVKERCARFLGIPVDGFPVAGPPRARRNPARLPRSHVVQRMTRPLRRVLPRAVRLIDRVNLKRRAYPPMDSGVRADLERIFAPEIQHLQALELVDVSHWLHESP